MRGRGNIVEMEENQIVFFAVLDAAVKALTSFFDDFWRFLTIFSMLVRKSGQIREWGEVTLGIRTNFGDKALTQSPDKFFKTAKIRTEPLGE